MGLYFIFETKIPHFYLFLASVLRCLIQNRLSNAAYFRTLKSSQKCQKKENFPTHKKARNFTSVDPQTDPSGETFQSAVSVVERVSLPMSQT